MEELDYEAEGGDPPSEAHDTADEQAEEQVEEMPEEGGEEAGTEAMETEGRLRRRILAINQQNRG